MGCNYFFEVVTFEKLMNIDLNPMLQLLQLYI